MSHFAVLVVGNDVEGQLAPYQENNMGDCPKEFLEFRDVEEEYRKEWETETVKEFYCASSSSWGQVVKPTFFAHVEGKPVGTKLTVEFHKSDVDAFHYFRKGECYDLGEEQESHKCPEKRVWVRVLDVATQHPDPKVCFEGAVYLEIINPPREIPLKEKYPTFEQCMTDFHGYKQRDPETGKWGYWENPNAKWDWHQVGGRWAGWLRIKPEFATEYADECPNFSWGWEEADKRAVLQDKRKLDSAKKGHVDWDAMMQEAGERAGAKYDKVMAVLGPLPENKTWDAVRDGLGATEDTRKEYWSQPRCVAWKEHFASDHENFGFDESPDNFLCSRERYVELARRSAVTLFAFVQDGKWAARGDMGWWGCVSNENDSWEDVFWTLLSLVPDDEQITVVDCHI